MSCKSFRSTRESERLGGCTVDGVPELYVMIVNVSFAVARWPAALVAVRISV